MSNTGSYVALLRGINVGGHHKVPMDDLKQEMTKLGFEKVITLLNSGNVIFDAPPSPEEELESLLAQHLGKIFGFVIPVLIRKSEDIHNLINYNPFEQVKETKDTRLYISFLKEEPTIDLAVPWASRDGSYRILEIKERTICSVLDLAISQTPKAMDELELLFGKNITTRNWNTVHRIAAKLASNYNR